MIEKIPRLAMLGSLLVPGLPSKSTDIICTPTELQTTQSAVEAVWDCGNQYAVLVFTNKGVQEILINKNAPSNGGRVSVGDPKKECSVVAFSSSEQPVTIYEGCISSNETSVIIPSVEIINNSLE